MCTLHIAEVGPVQVRDERFLNLTLHISWAMSGLKFKCIVHLECHTYPGLCTVHLESHTTHILGYVLYILNLTLHISWAMYCTSSHLYRLSNITSLLLSVNEYNNIQYIYTHIVHVRKYVHILRYASISYVPSTLDVQLITL